MDQDKELNNKIKAEVKAYFDAWREVRKDARLSRAALALMDTLQDSGFGDEQYHKSYKKIGYDIGVNKWTICRAVKLLEKLRYITTVNELTDKSHQPNVYLILKPELQRIREGVVRSNNTGVALSDNTGVVTSRNIMGLSINEQNINEIPATQNSSQLSTLNTVKETKNLAPSPEDRPNITILSRFGSCQAPLPPTTPRPHEFEVYEQLIEVAKNNGGLINNWENSYESHEEEIYDEKKKDNFSNMPMQRNWIKKLLNEGCSPLSIESVLKSGEMSNFKKSWDFTDVYNYIYSEYGFPNEFGELVKNSEKS